VPATAQACLANDPEGKVGAAQAAVLAAQAKKCDPAELPTFGYAGAAAVNAAGEAEPVALVADVFGPDLGAALIADAVDAAGARCQEEVAKGTALADVLFKLASRRSGCKGSRRLLAISNGRCRRRSSPASRPTRRKARRRGAAEGRGAALRRHSARPGVPGLRAERVGRGARALRRLGRALPLLPRAERLRRHRHGVRRPRRRSGERELSVTGGPSPARTPGPGAASGAALPRARAARSFARCRFASPT
jgi:hypothetical protein